MARRWTYREDYIVCKYVDENDVFISEQEIYNLVLMLKEEGYERSCEAVSKRVYDYQFLLTRRESKYANEQEYRIAELFIEDSQMAKAQRWINNYVNEVYCDDGLCNENDILDSSMSSFSNVPNQMSQYLPIDIPMVEDTFYNVLDELLNKYYTKHKDDKKNNGSGKEGV